MEISPNTRPAIILFLVFYSDLLTSFDLRSLMKEATLIHNSSLERAKNGIYSLQFNSIQSLLLLEADGKRMERKQHLHPSLAVILAKRVHIVEEATR